MEAKNEETNVEHVTENDRKEGERRKEEKKKVWIRKQIDVTFVLSFISPLQVAQHVSGNNVPIFRS